MKADAYVRSPSLLPFRTVPIVAAFRDVLGVDIVFFSFSTADENIHAPDEFYRPERFRLGLQAWARLWCRLANPLIFGFLSNC